MTRLHCRLSTLLWAVAVVSALLGGFRLGLQWAAIRYARSNGTYKIQGTYNPRETNIFRRPLNINSPRSVQALKRNDDPRGRRGLLRDAARQTAGA